MILFADHAKNKLLKELGKLGITKQTVIKILRSPDEKLYDAFTNRFVVVSWSHNVAVIYEKVNDAIVVITVIYSSVLKDIVNRRRTIGRWI